MKISRDKVDICRARKKKNVSDLAKAYGVSRARMNVILNQPSGILLPLNDKSCYDVANEVMRRYDVNVKFTSILEYLDLTKKGYNSMADKEEKDGIANKYGECQKGSARN